MYLYNILILRPFYLFHTVCRLYQAIENPGVAAIQRALPHVVQDLIAVSVPLNPWRMVVKVILGPVWVIHEEFMVQGSQQV